MSIKSRVDRILSHLDAADVEPPARHDERPPFEPINPEQFQAASKRFLAGDEVDLFVRAGIDREAWAGFLDDVVSFGLAEGQP
jgi:hypothetical protein